MLVHAGWHWDGLWPLMGTDHGKGSSSTHAVSATMGAAPRWPTSPPVRSCSGVVLPCLMWAKKAWCFPSPGIPSEWSRATRLGAVNQVRNQMSGKQTRTVSFSRDWTKQTLLFLLGEDVPSNYACPQTVLFLESRKGTLWSPIEMDKLLCHYELLSIIHVLQRKKIKILAMDKKSGSSNPVCIHFSEGPIAQTVTLKGFVQSTITHEKARWYCYVSSYPNLQNCYSGSINWYVHGDASFHHALGAWWEYSSS